MIDDLNDELNRFRSENSELRKRLTHQENKHRKMSNGDPIVNPICQSPMLSNPSPTIYQFSDTNSPSIEIQQNPIMFDYQPENSSNSQEQIHLNYALAMVSQVKFY